MIGEGYNFYRDDGRDYSPDFGRDTGGDANADYGGDLAGDYGVNLNELSEFGTDSSTSGLAENEVGENLNDSGFERLDKILDNFKADVWRDLPLEGQKQSIRDLADYVAADTGNENPPKIVFRGDMNDGDYGGYNSETNTIEINENMLADPAEAADTIAHEMWHAYQEQAAKDPNNPRAQEYRDGFDNYISPELDFEGYQNQMVEAEARDYAQGFKDRLAGR